MSNEIDIIARKNARIAAKRAQARRLREAQRRDERDANISAALAAAEDNAWHRARKEQS